MAFCELSRRLQNEVLVYDGSKGVMLQDMGLKGESAESWNITRENDVQWVHEEYVKAGSQVLQANTFSANRISLAAHSLADKAEALNLAGMRLALAAAGEAALAVGDMGCTGDFMEPAGDNTFDDMYDVFAEQAAALYKGGAKYIQLETFTDLSELRAAMLAVRENTPCGLLVTATFEGGRTLSGNPPEAIAIAADSLSAIAVGANCSGGPDTLISPIQAMSRVTALPLIVKPNAGLPEMIDGRTVFKLTPEAFIKTVPDFLALGVALYGGCCGTKPAHIKLLAEALSGKLPVKNTPDTEYICGSRSFAPAADAADCEAVELCPSGDVYDAVDTVMDALTDKPLMINYSGKPERSFIRSLMAELSGMASVPLGFCSKSDEALELLLRYYPGRAFASPASPLQQSICEKYGAYMINQIAYINN